jgi:hypothetical protein
MHVAVAALLASVVATSPPSLSLTPSTVRAGHAVRITGWADGCPVGDDVTIISHAFVHTHDFAGVPAVLAPVRRGGKFSATTTIPRSRRPSRYTVTARCGGGNLGLLRYLRVTR